MQTSIQSPAHWTANSHVYETNTKHLSNTSVDTLLTRMNDAYAFATARAVLDVGSGPGVTMALLIERFGREVPAGARLIASDFSAGMISQIQRLQQQEQETNPLWSRVEAKVLDAHDLHGIDDASISHITGTMVYNLVASGRRALEAAHRVLVPAGVIGMTLGAEAEWMDLMALAAKSIRGETAPSYQFPSGYSTIDGLRTEFQAVGFSAEYIETAENFIDVSDPKPFVDVFLRGKNPGAMFFVGDYSDAELDAFVDKFLKLVEERHPTLPRKLKGVMIVAVGKKLN